ncbi:hypothetical protein [Nonomuraea endophytica]|uniref:Lipoprotein n=1 Tax=Nonomuraea endophytica TaxID=714136 RepID=A0A7W8ADT4_9ACTN|nr:hypothetical protein [Nonomuraea endophytica]MBB5084404.1 hypothetical protein [Nonomuraea endophytica]
MTGRPASQNVPIGAVATLSALTLGACGQRVYERSPVTVHEDDKPGRISRDGSGGRTTVGG